jgi:DNA-binding NarL/FixJ family response regulator
MLTQSKRNTVIKILNDIHPAGSPIGNQMAGKGVQSFRRSESDTGRTDGLSPRECEVIELLAQGCHTKEIANNLAIGVPTVNTYIRRIYEKLSVRSRAQAVAVFFGIRPNSCMYGFNSDIKCLYPSAANAR